MEEDQETQNSEYNSVVETLLNMFGEVMNRDVIFAVVENCGGDLNSAADAVMNMTSDASSTIEQQTESPLNQAVMPQAIQAVENSSNETVPESPINQNSQGQETPAVTQPIRSYASMSQIRGAIPKQPRKPVTPITHKTTLAWTDQLREIMTNHNQGARILILMRGMPGSGKTYLARQIVEMCIGSNFSDYKTHICSTDDYFMVRGFYQYEKYKLHEAHEWNQRRVVGALQQGLSPIIVDNTNIEIWEMEPYVRQAVRNGYIIEVIEPNTPWAKKAYELFKRNTHNVPVVTIKRKLNDFVSGITGNYLRAYYGLSYPANMTPPVMRVMPAVAYLEETAPEPETNRKSSVCENYAAPLSMTNNKTVDPCSYTNISQSLSTANDLLTPNVNQDEITNPITEEQACTTEGAHDDTQEDKARQKRLLEIQRQIDEIEEVEKAWENGQTWEEPVEEKTSTNSTSEDPKPQRNSPEEQTPSEKLKESVKICNDWSQISMYMPPWFDTKTTEQVNAPAIRVETRNSSTCMEMGDTDTPTATKFKILTATPRNINLLHIPNDKEKIPNVRMLDKSTITNELLMVEANRCKNEEKHFVAFRKLFRNIPKASLRDIFDKCHGDVNWAVDIVIDSWGDNQSLKEAEDISDTEDEVTEPCNCLAAYDIIPDTETPSIKVAQPLHDTAESVELPIAIQKKVKPAPSESSMQLKRQIEKNIVLSDDHYSQHCLKIRKMRRGEVETLLFSPVESDLSAPDTPVSPNKTLENTASTSQDGNLPSTSEDKAMHPENSDDEEPTQLNYDKLESVHIGTDLVNSLDEIFDRKDIEYPSYIKKVINIPHSLLVTLNAFWMESLMSQLDAHDKHDANMLKEDEEFSRQLQEKQLELARAGKEPEVPDFKEIMDMDMAMSIYQKSTEEWQNKLPNDMAAKMTRDKLYNLFPDTPPIVLSEMLMAHDNNFENTVEVLLTSMGRIDILKQKNGLNKFVMQKELERQEKMLEEERKAISEVEWPLLPNGEVVQMSTVDCYRNEADKHLVKRQICYRKAHEYIQRGMPQVANYYSDIANFHKTRFEQANSRAAVSLVQVHAANSRDNATIDLHYLRVGEARESLDLFLDTHIQKLKELKINRCIQLYLITGRGLHSQGKPRVKPAVKKRLTERGLSSSECNPGLLMTKVCADNLLSYQVK